MHETASGQVRPFILGSAIPGSSKFRVHGPDLVLPFDMSSGLRSAREGMKVPYHSSQKSLQPVISGTASYVLQRATCLTFWGGGWLSTKIHRSCSGRVLRAFPSGTQSTVHTREDFPCCYGFQFGDCWFIMTVSSSPAVFLESLFERLSFKSNGSYPTAHTDSRNLDSRVPGNYPLPTIQ